MTRIVFTGLTALALLAGGCAVVPGPHHGTSRSALSSGDEDCPPGHRWSDGRCHDKGKGHDPAKHEKKRRK